jgi:hypothetical protein
MSYLPIILFALTVVALGYTSFKRKKFEINISLWGSREVGATIRTRDEAYKGKVDPPLCAPLNKFSLRGRMQVLVSLVLMASAVLIVLSHAYDPQEKHWAYGTLGTILGFWLRASK